MILLWFLFNFCKKDRPIVYISNLSPFLACYIMVVLGMNKGMNCGSELDIIRILVQQNNDTDFVWRVMDDDFYKT